MKHVIKIIKGSFVGMGSILPGISGSMIAAILKIYQELITALNQFTKHPIKSLIQVWQYIVGVFIGLAVGFLFINRFYDIIPIPLTLLFIGFILGAIPSIVKELKQSKIQWHHLLVMMTSMIVMGMFLLVQENETAMTGVRYYITVFFIGFITAAALITPGLSGATLLMALGFFTILIQLGSDTIEALVTFNMSEIIPFIPMIIVLILGLFTGLIVMGKIMYQFLNRYKVHFYYAVFGIVLISPLNIMISLQESTTSNIYQASFITWLISALLCLFGIWITYKISHFSKDMEEIK